MVNIDNIDYTILKKLLNRSVQDLDADVISDFLENKVVLITGAGGSIGSEISRQCIKFKVKKLILIDNCEYNLYSIGEELHKYKPVLSMTNVYDKDELEEVFDKHKPQIVIHAAAYKHVPLVEDNISPALKNNIVGTKNAIDCSIEHSVEKFVLISTDKAVRPTNVMGATKRVCELYAQNVNSKSTEIVSVRFGNVLGSSGSVIPKFINQIKSGKPLSVTHKDVTRYFMLINEACELVLQTAAIASGGEIFILDMGEPVKISDMAEQLLNIMNSDVGIEYTGLRPGEKLYEELLIDDTVHETQYDSITVAKPTHYDINKLNDDINELILSKKINKLDKLKEIVKEFNHNKG